MPFLSLPCGFAGRVSRDPVIVNLERNKGIQSMIERRTEYVWDIDRKPGSDHS
jgi:hypothetical protein